MQDIMNNFNKFSVILVCFLLNIISCNYFDSPLERNDIYRYCKKGDTLNLDLFKHVERIIKTEKWFYIWVDLNSDDRYFKQFNYLVVCDKNLILKGATCIYPDIYKVHGDSLFGVINDLYISFRNSPLKKYYRDDLPQNIKIIEEDRNSPWNGYQRDPFAIIDSIQLDQNFEFAKFYLRTNDSVGIPGRQDYLEDIQIFSKEINIFQILEIPISKLYIDRDWECIYTLEPNDTRKEMYTLSDETTEKLILELWSLMKYKKTKI